MSKRTRSRKSSAQELEQEDVLRRAYRFLCRLAYDLDPSWEIADAELLARDLRLAIEEEEDRWSEVFRAHLAEEQRQRQAPPVAPVFSLSARLREAEGPSVPCACGDETAAPAVEVSR
jgi:hypothetical protein